MRPSKRPLFASSLTALVLGSAAAISAGCSAGDANGRLYSHVDVRVGDRFDDLIPHAGGFLGRAKTIVSRLDAKGNDLGYFSVDGLRDAAPVSSGDVVTLASASGGYELARHDSSGAKRWAVGLPLGSRQTTIPQITGDGDDTLVVGAAFEQSLEIGCPKPAWGLYVSRWDARGKCTDMWSLAEMPKGLSFGYYNAGDYFRLAGPVVAPDGALALAGEFRRSLSLGGTTLTAAGGYEDTDLFVTVVERDGRVRFAHAAGSTSSTDEIGELAFDPSGSSLFLGGASFGDLTFGGKAEPTTGGDFFVASFDASSGSKRWARRFGERVELGDRVSGLASDGAGHVVASALGCTASGPDVEIVRGDGGVTTSCVCVLDDDTGVPRLRRQMNVSATAVAATPESFWVSGTYSGRPVIGATPVPSGSEFVARFDYAR